MTKERFNMLVGSIGAFIGVFVFYYFNKVSKILAINLLAINLLVIKLLVK